MEEIIQSFYIDWHLMVAQLVNFAIVIFVLWKFAYRPVLNILKERSEKIDKSLKQADEIEESVKNTEDEREKILKEASAKGQLIVEEASQSVEKAKKQKLEETRAESEKIITDAKEQIRNERGRMLTELRRELGELVLLASDKVTRGKISDQVNDQLINEVLEDLEKKETIKLS